MGFDDGGGSCATSFREDSASANTSAGVGMRANFVGSIGAVLDESLDGFLTGIRGYGSALDDVAMCFPAVARLGTFRVVTGLLAGVTKTARVLGAECDDACVLRAGIALT